jgi:hypothetical protein
MTFHDHPPRYPEIEQVGRNTTWTIIGVVVGLVLALSIRWACA